MEPTNDLTNKNQGEGDKRSARRYNEKATSHAKSGIVDPAAKQARAAVDAAPAAHAEAERTGKARAAELDPAVTMPEWWADRDESAWSRIKSAFRRDWEQTKNDLSAGKAGEQLDQSLIDTLRQMTGSDPLPIDGEPVGVDHAPDATRAFELGYNAAAHYNGEWTPTIESRLRPHWQALAPAQSWRVHRPYVFLGWRHRRSYM